MAGVPMMFHVEPQRDFVVLARDGSHRAGPVYAEEAVMVMNLIPEADRVVRQSDGVLIATKLRGPMPKANPRVPQMWAGIGSWGSGDA